MSRPGLTTREQLRRGLIGYWPLAAAGAPTTRSLWTPRSPMDLTDHGTVTRLAGPSNNLRDAAAFASASSQYYNTADVPQLAPRKRGLHVAGWTFHSNLSGTQSIIAQYDAAGNQRSWWLRMSTGVGFVFVTSQTGAGAGVVTLASTATVLTDTWYFLSAYWDGERAKVGIRVNLAAAEEATQAVLANSTGDLTFAARHGGNDLMNGRLAHWSVYERILTEKELRYLYNDGLGRLFARGN